MIRFASHEDRAAQISAAAANTRPAERDSTLRPCLAMEPPTRKGVLSCVVSRRKARALATVDGSRRKPVYTVVPSIRGLSEQFRIVHSSHHWAIF